MFHAHHILLMQALLQAESRLRAQETGASLLDEAANTLNTAAAAAEADAARTAAAKHDREVAAARRQLRQMAANQQQEQLHALERQQAVEARSRSVWIRAPWSKPSSKCHEPHAQA